MSLTLKVISYRGLPQAQDISAVFDRNGGLLGRSRECSFVLPDPEKFISRKHARIDFVDGSYRLTDTSTAGTGVPNRSLLLQHDSVALADGDLLKIGDYEIRVIIGEDAAFATPAFPEAPEPSLVTPASAEDWFGPFGEFSKPREERTEEASGQTPSFLETPDVPVFHASFTPPEPEPLTTSPGGDLSDFNIEDLLAELERPAAVRTPSPNPAEQGWEIPDDLFKGFEALAPASAEAEPPSPPETPAPGRSLPQEPELAAAAVVTPPRETPAEAAIRIPKPALVPERSGTPRTRAAETPVVAAAEPAVQDDKREMELFRLFLQGAGIADASFVRGEDLPKLMTTLGVLFRDLAEGLMTVLRARAELKSQFRVAMTTMRPMNNNPLKFTANVEEAMKIMLTRDHPGFVDPVVAVREGFGDLMNHQMAMTAGIQASLAELLERFDPERFEKAYEEGIVFQKKAKCWEAYRRAYAKLVEEALENFFGDAFAEAYERQLRGLRAGNGRPA